MIRSVTAAPLRARREDGVAAVELALVMPLIVTLLVGVVEGGDRYAKQDQVSHYAAVAARDIAIDPTRSVSGIVAGLKAQDGNATVYDTPVVQGCSASQQTAKVTITATLGSPTGMFGTYTVNGVGVARCEN